GRGCGWAGRGRGGGRCTPSSRASGAASRTTARPSGRRERRERDAVKVELPYGDGMLTATLPAGARRVSVEPVGALAPLADLDGAVRQALATPFGLPRIGELVKPDARVTIAFDDHTTGSVGPVRPRALPPRARRPSAARRVRP